MSLWGDRREVPLGDRREVPLGDRRERRWAVTPDHGRRTRPRRSTPGGERGGCQLDFDDNPRTTPLTFCSTPDALCLAICDTADDVGIGS
jgi:hypothetical protein